MVLAFSAIGSFAEAFAPSAKPGTLSPNGQTLPFSADSLARGLKEAPAIVAKAGVRCEIREAADMGEARLFDSSGKNTGKGELYEVGCHDDLGYLIAERRNAPPSAVDCITAARVSPVVCRLPGNTPPAIGLRRYLVQAGRRCDPTAARSVGQDDAAKFRRFEVRCGDGNGYILDIPLADGSGPTARADDCLAAEGECRMVSHVWSVAVLARKIGPGLANTCAIGDARHVGAIAARHTELYEVSCRSGQDGQLVELDANGAVKSVRACADVKLVGAACTLKPVATIDPVIAQAQAGTDPRPSVVTGPRWLSIPSGDDIARVFPERAARMGASGRAEMSCTVNGEGGMQGCGIIEEAPEGFGFGEAALNLAPRFHMLAVTRDGQPVAGAKVIIPIRFLIAR